MGIVGLGRIGSAVALRAKAWGMQVVVYDPYLPRGQEIALGVSRVESLEQVLAVCDALALHVPLSDEPANMIDAAALAQMPAHAVLINTVRGALVDIDALHAALIEQQLAGAALDVLPQEPPNATRPLIKALQEGDERLGHRLLLTPHAAWYSHASQSDARRLSTLTLAAYLRDGELRNCVNGHFLV